MLRQNLNARVASNNELEVIFDKKIKLVNIDEDYARSFLKSFLPCYISADTSPDLLKGIQDSMRPALLKASTQKNQYPNHFAESLEIDLFRLGARFYVMIVTPWEKNNPNLIKIPA